MDEVLPRPTPEIQLELLKKITQVDGDVDEDISDEFDVA